MFKVGVGCSLLFFLFAVSGWTQVTTGQIFGTVRDSSGAQLPETTVRVTGENVAASRDIVTNNEGFFLFSNLPPGFYRMEVTRSGFKSFTRSGIVITAGQRVEANTALQLGELSEKVDVTAQGASVETASGAVGQLIDGSQTRDIALNGRNLTQLLMVLPGVATTTDEFDRGGISFGNFGSFNVNGLRATSMQATVDGGLNQDSGNITSMTNNVGVDFVSEVKVTTSGYSAEYGRMGGGQLNFTTRSGTDQFHGTLFEFLRNDKLNARSFFAPKVEKLNLNDFGWNFGGWIPFPGISSATDKKLFFFGGQEYKRRIDGATRRATIPTHAERAGIISSSSQLMYPSNFPVASLRGQPIQDPSRATPSNPTGKNIIPQQYISANGRAVSNIFDTMEGLASVYSDTPTANNVTYQLANSDIRREDILRLDYHHSQKNNFTFRYLYDTGSNFSPYETGNVPTFWATRRNRAPNYQFSWTNIPTPNIVNEFAVVSNYLNLERFPEGDYRFPGTYGLNIQELYGNEMEVYGIPSIGITGYTTISGARPNPRSPVWDLSFRDSFSWMHGRHNWKTGILAIRNRKNERNTGSLNGSVNFNPSGNSITTGNALADALLGNFRSYSEADNDKFAYIRFTQIESYVADTWRITPNFTLDYGVRYYYFGAPYDRFNGISTFVPGAFDPSKAQQVIPTGPSAGELAPGVGQPFNGIVTPGSQFNDPNRLPSSVRDQDLFANLPKGIYDSTHRLSPRLGFAWDPSGKGDFSVRGGAAIYYNRLSMITVNSAGNPPFVNNVTLFDGPIDDPANGRRSAQFPVGITSISPGVEPPAIYNWNFGFQKKTLGNSLLDVNYVSTQGRHLLRRPDINNVAPDIQFNNSKSNINALRPYPGYTNVRLFESSASSSYHGLQVGLSRRYSNSFTYSVAYTWSKVLSDSSQDDSAPEDPLNYRRERSHTDFDRNHVLVFTYIWQLPFFRNQSGITGKLLGGWELSGLTQFQSGAWLTPTFNTPTGTRRPDAVGPVQYINPREYQTLTGGNGQPVAGNFYFDPTPGDSFVAPPNDRYGSAAPFTVRGPGRNNWDMSLFKNIPLRENINLQFRAEAFNVWNHANFRNPNMNASDRNYATISDAGPPRLLQFGLKLLF